LQRLASIFRNQVIPLLQEYFFEDWQRIAWVLNDHRKDRVDRFLLKEAADINLLFGTDDGPPQERPRWKINPDAFQRRDSYLGIVSVTVKANEPSHRT
jgi:5-methylcytosine-specific restriction protein B